MSVIPQNAPFFTQFVLLTLVKTGLGEAASSSAATEAASEGSRGHTDACGRTPGLAAAAGPNGLRQTAPKSAVSTRSGGQDRPQITLWDLTGKLSLCRAG